MVSLRVLSWNLFHGRDAPPDRALHTWRSRILGRTESNATHVQVNRPLRDEFADVLARLDWDVALLQEVPPGWLRPLCRAAGADGASALTSRNAGAALRAALARLNPDLMASGEGGSNQVLARPPWRIAEVRRLTLTRSPERRRLIWAGLTGSAEAAIGNLHATAHDTAAAARDVLLAAERSIEWAGERPLVFGGDLNLRPDREPEAFAQLAALGFTDPAEAGSIDHVLARGAAFAEPSRRLEDVVRELPAGDGRRLRLSDHAPVSALVRLA